MHLLKKRLREIVSVFKDEQARRMSITADILIAAQTDFQSIELMSKYVAAHAIRCSVFTVRAHEAGRLETTAITAIRLLLL